MTELALLTTSQVALKFGVDGSAVRKWVADGKLTPAVKTPGGHYRFRESDVAAFIKEQSDVRETA